MSWFGQGAFGAGFEGVRRTRSAARLGLLVGALALVAACKSPPRVPMHEGPREFIAEDYESILNRWTRAERLYSFQGIDDVLTVTATYESWDFRWAYVVRYADDFKLSIDERKQLLAETLEQAHNHHQFYVSLYGSRYPEGELLAKEPAWIVRLVDDKGHVTAPEEIIKIRKPGALERTYFPYTSSWRQCFRIRFAARTGDGPTIADDAALVALRFSGPLGNLELTWLREN
jgi:hypothetical protein